LEFPGNVRQLENLCNWITVMAPGQLVEIIDLPSDLTRVGDVAAVSAQDVALEIPVINQPESQILTSCLQSSTSSTLPVDWHQMLESEASAMLSSGEPEVIVQLGKIFEATVIKAACGIRTAGKMKRQLNLVLGVILLPVRYRS
jgi:two-component system nitrogen regulation response regulator GlnG